MNKASLSMRRTAADGVDLRRCAGRPRATRRDVGATRGGGTSRGMTIGVHRDGSHDAEDGCALWRIHPKSVNDLMR